jgi:hypothetical protein
VRWLTPAVAFPVLVAKDVWRVNARFLPAGYGPRDLWRLPLFWLVLLATEPVTLAGMLRTLRRDGVVEPP